MRVSKNGRPPLLVGIHRETKGTPPFQGGLLDVEADRIHSDIASRMAH